MTDNHGRQIDYLRLAVTDRCNLRCNYCMPAEGIDFLQNKHLLQIDELKWLAGVLVEMGISKIRLTGGEPFARKGLMELLEHLVTLKDLEDISVTTNATLIGPHIDRLWHLGIKNINVSLDAIEPNKFAKITRRDCYVQVMENLMKMVARGFNVRINFIVLDGQNEDDIIPLLQAMKQHAVSVRFLEEMPFNGGSREFKGIKWNYKKILDHIATEYPDYQKLESPATSTSINYKIPGHKGTFGIIPSFSRTFCGSCNRLRVTANGDVITCLYGKPKLNLKSAIRHDKNELQVRGQILRALGTRHANGLEAQRESAKSVSRSMTTIGG